MLPNYETCRKHVMAYKRREGTTNSETITFPQFWKYKTGLEKAGKSILDDKNIDKTASRLCGLFSHLKVQNSALTETSRMKQVLRNIQPYYSDICQVKLGSGKINLFRDQIESIYEKMDQKASKGDGSSHSFSIVSKTEILMAIWGQVPRLDTLNRKRFENWTHWPAPEKLPFLTAQKTWYRPDEFREIIVTLDKWVMAWPATNYGRSFESCCLDLCPGIPLGRQIDLVYHWKLPKNWIDSRLQTRGSFFGPTYIDTIGEYSAR